MEEATGISAQALMALRPGRDDIREKLRLASARETTRVEDAAYSFLGILSLFLAITYGERGHSAWSTFGTATYELWRRKHPCVDGEIR